MNEEDTRKLMERLKRGEIDQKTFDDIMFGGQFVIEDFKPKPMTVGEHAEVWSREFEEAKRKKSGISWGKRGKI